MNPDVRRKAISERIPPEHREELRLLTRRAAPSCSKNRVKRRRLDKTWMGSEPYTEEELQERYAAARALWAPILAKRTLVAEPDVDETTYRKTCLADRSKSLSMMGIEGERIARGAPVSNEDPLPKANSTRLAANLQLWCEFNSWKVCEQCNSMMPRDLTPAGLEGLLDPRCSKRECNVCSSKQLKYVPQVDATPDHLRELSKAVREALSPIEVYYG